jgi:ubiquinone/menaquinone biosynthesis C-methylase UbiE
MKEAPRRLAGGAIYLRAEEERIDQELLRLDSTIWPAQLSDLRMSCKVALTIQKSTLQRFGATLDEVVDRSAVLAVAAGANGPPALYLEFSDYFIRDWSGTEATEAELHQIRAALEAQIHAHLDHPDTALVLGAGAGRIAWDLQTSFRNVIALDDSPTMGLAFAKLMRDGLPVCSLATSNVRTRDEIVAAFNLGPEVSQVRSDGSAFHYCIADSLAVPLPDHSVDAIVSVYFTDVVPLPDLLKEVTRVLKPGGLFLHFGPLHRHGQSTWSLLTAEDVRDALRLRGFSVLAESWVEVPHLNHSGRLFSRLYTNWCLSARAPTERPSIGPHTVLRLLESAYLVERTRLGVDDTDRVELRLEAPSFAPIEIEPGVRDVLSALDGRRSIAQGFAHLAEQGFRVDAEAQREIVVLLEGYAASGLLTSVPV